MAAIRAFRRAETSNAILETIFAKKKPAVTNQANGRFAWSTNAANRGTVQKIAQPCVREEGSTRCAQLNLGKPNPYRAPVPYCPSRTVQPYRIGPRTVLSTALTEKPT